tara:strand:+ start:414 stop:908 length:495 start_codon:yes stop_codon:yes gene_type:complete
MAFFATAFKTNTRAALVAIALGATGLVAAPAFAQSGSAGFSIEMHGNGGGSGFGNGRHGDRGYGWNDGGMRCLSDREVVRGVRAYGYDRVEITRQLRGDRVDLRAVKRNWVYAMRVDKCSGDVSRLDRLGRASGGYRGGRREGGFRNDAGFDGGGFGFQFNFAN